MKKILLLSLLLFSISVSSMKAACLPGYSEIIVQIIPDSWPWETTWNITDNGGNILASGAFDGDTICVPTGSCVVFNIYDSFGDGIYSPGGYWVYVDGTLVASGNSFGYGASQPISCPPGMYCSSPLTLTPGSYTASFDNTFYAFTCTLSGTYNITTCGLNACNTKIWVYSNCTGQLLDEGPVGAYAYNDDSQCGLLADLNVVFIAGNTYYVRIGDSMDNCSAPVNFEFSYVGPVSGCTDPTACNYNPLATVDDGSCMFFPNPNCAGPDLVFDSLAFASSLMMMTVTASNCDVDEGCVTGYGTRHVIAFSSKINNIGTLDYYIGSPSANPTMFNQVNCHGHAHYEGYGDYRLYDSTGTLIPVGHKNGFCVIDLCGAGQYTCGNMGISVNCYDIYGAGTQCQWVDITDVPDGQYRLAVIVNSHHLPDALNHYEINHTNNALQVCIEITHNSAGIPSYTILPNCLPFVDCMGIPGGAAVPDCNAICGGPSIYGNVNGDLALDSLDIDEYANLLEGSMSVSSCNDLNGDGELTVYDAALSMWCINTPHHPHPAGSNFNDCNFPHNILNPNDSTGLAISAINFNSNYVDIELASVTADIKAYQFKMHGITVSSVVSLSDPVEFPVDIRTIPSSNEIFAISVLDSVIARSNNPQMLCRVYFSAITDTVICIENIREIINQDIERTVTYIYGGCVNTTSTTLTEVTSDFPVAIIPNPATNFAYLQLPNGITPDEVEIMDMTGRITKINVTTKGLSHSIDLTNYNSGLYIVRVKSERQAGHTRFLKL
jgi:hypothetical protein